MIELNDGQKTWVSDQLTAAIHAYKVANDKQEPNGRWMSEKRQSLELQCLPLSEVIRKMLKIGHPDDIHNRDAQRAEFETLARELDRREKTYLKA